MGCTKSKFPQHRRADYSVNQRDIDAKAASIDDIAGYDNDHAFQTLASRTGWESFEVRLLYAEYQKYATPEKGPLAKQGIRPAQFSKIFKRCCHSMFESWSDAKQSASDGTRLYPSHSEPRFIKMIDFAFAYFDRNGKGKVDFVDFVVGLHLLCRSDAKEQSDFLHDIYSSNGGSLTLEDVDFLLESIRRPQQRANFPEPSTSDPNPVEHEHIEGSRMSTDERDEILHEVMILKRQLQTEAENTKDEDQSAFPQHCYKMIEKLERASDRLTRAPSSHDADSSGGDGGNNAKQRDLLEKCVQANRLLFGQIDPTTATVMEAGESEGLNGIWDYHCATLRELCRFEGGRLSMENFAAWALHHLDLQKNRLFTGFEVFPSRDDELKLYKKWTESDMERDDAWCVVDQNWWDNWCAYIGADTEANRHVEQSRPIKISNQKLLDPNSYGDAMKRGLQENSDFQLAHRDIWDQLFAWYGGGPTLERRVVERGVQRKQLRVELYPMFVRLRKAEKVATDAAPEEILSVPLHSSPTDLHHKIAEREDVPEDELRLWARQNEHDILRPLYPPRTTAQENDLFESIDWIGNGAQIIIDMKENGKWHIEDPARKFDSWQKLVSEKEWNVDQQLDARDSEHKWFLASIKKIREDDSGDVVEIKVHYDGYHERYDEWIPVSDVCTGCYLNGKCENLEHRLAPLDSLNTNQRRSPGSPERGKGRRAPSDVVSKGLVGLSNLGNTCFMNSTLQCMSNTPMFREYFLTGKFEKEINRSNPLGTGGKLANSFATLLSAMWDGKRRVFAPKVFKRTIGDFAPNFEGYQQQDSQELLQYLLDGIHEDLNRIRDKPLTEKVEYDAGQKGDWEIADECWNRYLMRNKSVVVDLFMALIKSHVTCPKCKRSSITFEPYMYLQLPIPGYKNKLIDVNLFRLKGTTPGRSNIPCKYRIRVPQYSSMADVFAELETMSGVKADSMIAADIWKNKIYRLRLGKSHISSIRQNDVTNIYEQEVLPEESRKDPEDDYKRPGWIYNLQDEPTRNYNHWPVCGEPHVFTFWAGSTCEEIHEIIRKRLTRWYPNLFKQTDPETGKPETFYTVWLTDKSGSSITEMPICNKTIKASPHTQLCFLIQWERKWVDYVIEQYKRINDDPGGSMSTGADKRQRISITDCLDEYTRAEKLDRDNMWYCNKCKDHFRATKKIDIWDYPDYLIMHLKRFQNVGRRREKINVLVDFPLHSLDLAKHCLKASADVPMDKRGSKPIYDLFAVSNHSGGLGGGHYTAYAKNSENNSWYYFNDRSVTPVREDRIVSTQAYVLFYKRRT